MKKEEALKIIRDTYHTEEELKALEALIPELRESEDEKIRKFLLKVISDIAGGWSFEKYGITKKEALTWLEKQQEQKPAEPSDEELQRHQDELYDFKVFAAKQAREHHISFVHDFEWNNFCAELLSYFNEKQKPAEWSEDDEKMLRTIISDGSRGVELDSKQIDWLQSLRPSWKPSEEQPEVDLNEEVKRYYSENFEYLSSDSPTLSILTNIARHFYELALTQERRTSK